MSKNKDQIHTCKDYKNNEFGNSYTINEFESLVANKEYQEAYWAAILLMSMGIKLDQKMISDVAMIIENHWPEIYDDLHEET